MSATFFREGRANADALRASRPAVADSDCSRYLGGGMAFRPARWVARVSSVAMALARRSGRTACRMPQRAPGRAWGDAR